MCAGSGDNYAEYQLAYSKNCCAAVIALVLISRDIEDFHRLFLSIYCVVLLPPLLAPKNKYIYVSGDLEIKII